MQRALFVLALAASTLVPSIFLSSALTAQELRQIGLEFLGRYETGIIDEGAAEIVSYDAETERVFLVNADANQVQILDISDPRIPELVGAIDLDAFGEGVANSVAVHDGVVAVATAAADEQQSGFAAFFDADGNFLSQVEVGALPDMITFTPDGSKVLVANEGEPLDYCDTGLAADPEGSVSIIDLAKGAENVVQEDVATADFGAFNDGVADGVRVFGPGATVAQDLEPEYIAVQRNGATAWVTLQENNAVAVVDIEAAEIVDVVPLGFKDHSLERNGFDASNRDDTIRIRTWPTYGMFQPDSIASYVTQGGTYLVTANEGDARDYDCYSEEERVEDLALDPDAFDDIDELQLEENLGRLLTTSANGDVNGDGFHEEIYSYGARSFSIWSKNGELIWDSGNEIELILAGAQPENFNSNESGDSFDARSDDKGPEPEGLATGRFRGRSYAFVGLERSGGIITYDVTDPYNPFFVDFINTQDFGEEVSGDVSPEGLHFISQRDSPIGRPLLVVGYEVSGTVAIFKIDAVEN